MLRVDKGDDSTARAQDELRLVLEQHLDDLVSVSQQDGLLGSLPFLDVNQVALIVFLSDWCVLLSEAKFERLELLIAVQVALEVLEEHDLLVDGLWVVEEVELADLVRQTFHGLTVAIESRLLLASLDVVEVEHIWVQDDFRAVIEEHAIRVVRQLVTESILGAEVNKLDDEFGARLILSLLDEQVLVKAKGDSLLDLGQFRGCLLLLIEVELWFGLRSALEVARHCLVLKSLLGGVEALSGHLWAVLILEARHAGGAD